MHLKIYIILVIFSVCIFFVSGCAGTSNLAEQESLSQAQDVNTPSKASLNEIIETIQQDSKTFPARLWKDGKTTFTKPDNIAALLLAGGASIAMHQEADKNIADYFDKYQQLQGSDAEALNLIGHPMIHSAASYIWYFLSIRNKDDINKDRALTMRTALTLNWLATTALQYIRGNDTPNGEYLSWPSGHASSSFTIASVMDEFYGPKVGIPAYAIASFISYRMMDTGDNYSSDVVFGATLGWVIGHTVASQNNDLKIAGFDIVPFIPQTEKPAFGIGLIKRF